jgi:hypothetical protein
MNSDKIQKGVIICENIGGFVDEDNCFIRPINLRLSRDEKIPKCAETPWHGELITKRFTDEESINLMGIHSVAEEKTSWQLCSIPLENLLTVSPQTLEQLRKKMLFHWASRKEYRSKSPTEKEIYLAKQGSWKKKQYEMMTPTEKEDFFKKHKEWEKRWFASLSPAEQIEYRAKRQKETKEWFDSLTPKELAELYAKHNKARRERYMMMSPQDKEQHLINERERDRKRRATKRGEI